MLWERRDKTDSGDDLTNRRPPRSMSDRPDIFISLFSFFSHFTNHRCWNFHPSFKPQSMTSGSKGQTGSCFSLPCVPWLYNSTYVTAKKNGGILEARFHCQGIVISISAFASASRKTLHSSRLWLRTVPAIPVAWYTKPVMCLCTVQSVLHVFFFFFFFFFSFSWA